MSVSFNFSNIAIKIKLHVREPDRLERPTLRLLWNIFAASCRYLKIRQEEWHPRILAVLAIVSHFPLLGPTQQGGNMGKKQHEKKQKAMARNPVDVSREGFLVDFPLNQSFEDGIVMASQATRAEKPSCALCWDCYAALCPGGCRNCRALSPFLHHLMI